MEVYHSNTFNHSVRRWCNSRIFLTVPLSTSSHDCELCVNGWNINLIAPTIWSGWVRQNTIVDYANQRIVVSDSRSASFAVLHDHHVGHGLNRLKAHLVLWNDGFRFDRSVLQFNGSIQPARVTLRKSERQVEVRTSTR